MSPPPPIEPMNAAQPDTPGERGAHGVCPVNALSLRPLLAFDVRAAWPTAHRGMHVTVVEKRADFSRVNILLLWPQTADDLMAYGARTLYPKFSNNNKMLHLGTREIQLVLL